MRILNWNTWKASPNSRSRRFQNVSALVHGFDADIICLTEAHPKAMPDASQTITSGPGNRGWQAASGPRKVVLWGRSGWNNVDDYGSEKLPKGRFVSATTKIDGSTWNIVGMCIPYRAYPMDEDDSADRKGSWLGAIRYMSVLQSDLHHRYRNQAHTILVGDFNLQIPPKNYPYPSQEVNQSREETFCGLDIPTAGELDESALDKRFIDHVALSQDIELESMRFISRFAEDGKPLSDHNGVCIEVAPV